MTGSLDASNVGYPLSPEQLVIACSGNADRHLRIELHGTFEVSRLAIALTALVGEQAQLRSNFQNVAGYRELRCFTTEFTSSSSLSLIEGNNEAQVLAKVIAQREVDTRWPVAGLVTLNDRHARLLLAVPRLALDNARLLLARLSALYAAENFATEISQNVPHYQQYVEWRLELAEDKEAEQGRQYWEQHLVEAQSATTPWLPWRKAVTSGQINVLRWPSTPALQGAAEVLQLPVPVVAQAAWWALLARLAGQEQVLVGWRHDCREDYEYFANTVGVFEKILPLKVRIGANQSLRQWVGELAELQEQHRTWQEFLPTQPATLNISRGYGFAVVRQPYSDTADLHWQLEEHIPSTDFELELCLQLDARGLAQGFELRYHSGRYDTIGLAILEEQWLSMLEQLHTRLEMPLEEIPLLGPRQLALQIKEGPCLEPENIQLPERISAWATHCPEATALIDDGGRWSWAELEANVASVAAGLRARGVQPGDRVGLALPRSAAMVIALLATWRVGAAYVPIDTQWPEQRRCAIAEAAGVRLLVGNEPAKRISSVVPAVDFAVLSEGTGSLSSGAVVHSASDVAYVLFTSGSTGTPKGVVVEHGQLLNYTLASNHALDLKTCRRPALISTVAADLGNTTLFSSLFNGAELHIASETVMHDTQKFQQFLVQNAIDCMKIVPSHLAALLDDQVSYLPATLILGGEAPSKALVARIFAIRPDCRLFNHYGPTEATIGVLWHHIQPGAERNRVPLDQVLANNQVYLFNGRHKPVAIGEIGELYIGGRQLARGYLAMQEDDHFLMMPQVEGGRLYRTGDRARLLPDGCLELCSRVDQQVKIRGIRVEPGEVEAVLQDEPGVREVAVQTWLPMGSDEPRLCAYLVLKEAMTTLEIIRQSLQERLPAPLLPAHLFSLPNLPRLANGKLDRRALPDPEVLCTSVRKHAPRTALENCLHDCVAELLGRDWIDMDEDFFLAGGNSLMVIRLVTRLRQMLHLEVQPALIFEHPTVTTLAAALLNLESKPGTLEHTARLRQRLAALSPEQRAILLEKSRQANI